MKSNLRKLFEIFILFIPLLISLAGGNQSINTFVIFYSTYELNILSKIE